MASAERLPGWTYVEPDTLEDIAATLGAQTPARSLPEATLRDKINAAWLGRIAGCNVGKPVEWGSHWTAEHIREYLILADAYPLRDYVPMLDPMPEGFTLTACWPETTRGNVKGSARDDDIDYPILALHLLETHGTALRPEHVGAAWTRLFPIEQVFTAERAAYVNMIEGFTGSDVARRRNPYREWIGAQIRGDVFGYVHAGSPWEAAKLSFQDASLSHVGNGIYGEMWAAALVAAAFTASSATEAVEQSIAVVPPQSRLAEALRHTLELKASGITWDAALAEIEAAYGHYSWVHTINNAAAVAVALLWSDDDFLTGVGRVVMSGWDTDSNGATVGSVLGVIAGTRNLPDNLIAPLENRTRSALFGFDNSVISDLADRTTFLALNGLT
ncbi:ADP-ribosylglycohydrolase family protein [Diaminobutyricibacter tongyongensis]|uniref:ADP-ribosylglycohydrolase family protein n=2 Tax=Leifsonia tongyongensis TaxID=1268043 RepID=A0A6L9Y339_9MICO|nr:ADP-ribosylglycohydrolase family protein [Diaminobutyricibacter tongyongensis]NEN07684.1 ADP-ribosylglycohydrolase family protein [Diaminobutyricibacter tongyongensis]